MHWYLDVLKKYAEFNGRARRQEYWMFALFSFIVSALLMTIDVVVGTNSLLYLLYSLGVLLPSIGVAIRRLHDTDRSGWWILISFIPLIGWVWFLALMVFEGTRGSNQYGADPKG